MLEADARTKQDVTSLAELVYELLDAHVDTIALAGELPGSPAWDAHLDYIRDLRKLLIVEKQFGFKLEAAADKFGHADRAFALAIGLPMAMQMASRGFTGTFQPPASFEHSAPDNLAQRFGLPFTMSGRNAASTVRVSGNYFSRS